MTVYPELATNNQGKVAWEGDCIAFHTWGRESRTSAWYGNASSL
jgi:hypothetical protein